MPEHESNSIRHIYHLFVRRQIPDGQWAYMTVGYYTSVLETEAGKARLRRQDAFARLPEDCFELKCYRVNIEYDDPMFSGQFPPPENSE